MRVQRVYQQSSNDLQEPVELCRMDSLIEIYRHQRGNMIPLLQGVQDIYGYLPRTALEKLAADTGLSVSEMYGVATFYAQFRLEPVGKHIIKVCHGTACHVQGSENITLALEESLHLKDGETTTDRLFTLESVACLGCCSLAPVMMIDEIVYSDLTREKAVNIVKNIRLAELEAPQ